jgi:streptomycin 3"-adenylyltransferase
MKKQSSTAIGGWENCPKSVRDKVDIIITFFRRSLGDDLTGFYLHGSLAQNCFNPKTSDIDFVVVVEKKLAAQQKKDIIAYLQSIDTDGIASPEMSIVTRESLKNLVYPSPFELHYSNSTRDAYTGGQVSWDEQRFDTDLAAHYMAIYERGICLYGKPVKEVFPEIPPEMFIASIVQDLHWLRQEITRVPVKTVILNPCRALAYIKEGKYLSKKEGGEWALKNLPPVYTALIEKALAAYSGVNDVTPPSQHELSDFIDYAIKDFIYLASKTDAENLFFKRSY